MSKFKALEKEIKACLENSACAGRSPGDYTEYIEKLTVYLMEKIEKDFEEKKP
jgi:hypothetical protein